MLMAGFGVLAAAISVPTARGSVPGCAPAGRIPAAPPGNAAGGNYIFQDEFDGPAGSAPDSSKWTVARARETMKDPTFWERPENVGQYRDDRQNVFLDGKSNIVLRAAKDGNTYTGFFTITGPDTAELKGCAMGFICKSQNWTRVK